MDKESQKKKLKSSFEIVWHIASGAINIISFIIAIVSSVRGNLELTFGIVIAIIAINSILLSIFAAYATWLWFRVKKIEKINKQELDSQVNDINDERKKISEYKLITEQNIEFLEKSIEFSNLLNSECMLQINKSILDINNCINKITSIAASKDSFSKKTNQNFDALKELKTNVKKRYIAFFTFCTEKIKSLLDLNFKFRNLGITNSITIKQLNSAICWTDRSSKLKNISEAKIITAFRDTHTYNQFVREVGKKEYTIFGNTDFNHCMSNTHYIKNNINDSDIDTYQNENSDFFIFL